MSAAAIVALVAIACDESPELRTARSERLELAAGAPSRSSGATSLAIGPLAPGTYVTPHFSPRLTFAVEAGWVLTVESTNVVKLTRGDDPDAPYLGLALLDDLVVPEMPFVADAPAGVADGDPLAIDDATRPAPASFLEYLRALDHVRMSPPSDVTIGGRAGQQADWQMESLAAVPGRCGPDPGPCFVIFVRPDPLPLPIHDFAPGRFRSAVLSGPEGSLLVHLSAPNPARFAELEPVAARLLATLTIGTKR